MVKTIRDIIALNPLYRYLITLPLYFYVIGVDVCNVYLIRRQWISQYRSSHFRFEFQTFVTALSHQHIALLVAYMKTLYDCTLKNCGDIKYWFKDKMKI